MSLLCAECFNLDMCLRWTPDECNKTVCEDYLHWYYMKERMKERMKRVGMI